MNTLIRVALFTVILACVYLPVALVYDMGVRQGELTALVTAYEVCKKVAPLKDGVGCK